MTTLSNRQHDQIEAAKETARQRIVDQALRGGISPPRVPDSALPDPTYYDLPPEIETVKIDPAAGRSAAEEDAWRRVYMDPKAVALRDVEAAALERLDALREDKMLEDGIETRRSSEPVRRSPRAGFYWQEFHTASRS